MHLALRRDDLLAAPGGAKHWADPGVQEIPFEAGTSGYADLPGGISLYVGSIDLRRRSISGWMWIAEDHRHIWLRDLKAGEPAIFQGSDGQMRELAITCVSRKAVTGYVILPKSRRRAVAGLA